MSKEIKLYSSGWVTKKVVVIETNEYEADGQTKDEKVGVSFWKEIGRNLTFSGKVVDVAASFTIDEVSRGWEGSLMIHGGHGSVMDYININPHDVRETARTPKEIYDLLDRAFDRIMSMYDFKVELVISHVGEKRENAVRMPEEDLKKPPFGLYRVYWADGGSSIAAIGQDSNGDRWIAPTNWIKDANYNPARIKQLVMLTPHGSWEQGWGEPRYKVISKAVLDIFAEETGVDVWDSSRGKLHVRLSNQIARLLAGVEE